MDRRTVLGAGVRSVATLGIAKALSNTLVGYGQFGLGTNLYTQALETVVRERMPEASWFRAEVGEWALFGRPDDVWAQPAGGELEPADRHELPTEVGRVVDRLRALRNGEVTFSFMNLAAFEEFLAERHSCPHVVDVLRPPADPPVDSAAVEAFAEADPADTTELVRGLADGFVRETRYDGVRYLAGSVEENLIPFETDIRGQLAPTVSFAELSTPGQTSLFCGEYTQLANRAFRVVSAVDQSIPVTGLHVFNERHKHIYNGVASAVETADGIVIPVTFVDYTFSTLYADLEMEGIVGEGIDAYTTDHRADDIWW